MSDDEAVEAFLSEADDALGEYERGYVDADAALSRLAAGIEELRAEYEGE